MSLQRLSLDVPLASASLISFVTFLMHIRDPSFSRYGIASRCLHGFGFLFVLFSLSVPFSEAYYARVVFCTATMILVEIVWIPLPEPVRKGKLTWSVLICLFRPYFLPESNEAAGHRRRQTLVDFYRSNRVRAAATWTCVGITRLANLYSPLLLGKAGKNLSNGKYADASVNVAVYGLFNIVGHFCPNVVPSAPS